MNSSKIKEVISAEALVVKPSEDELKILNKRTSEIVKVLEENLKKSKTSADVFVGGSFAKGTLIKKDKYDVDIFVRFDSGKYTDEKISALLAKVVPRTSKKIHGSRDYFSLSEGNIVFEIIPVLKIKNPAEAKNITDLSYFHVNYISSKIKKNKKLADEIRLGKAFAFYQNCYGAESYINGFSGYGVELIIVAYGSFTKFISEIAKFELGKDKKNKILLDSEKLYKNKDAIMKEMNESKLLSPIVLVDPTFKDRNALAALSFSTFLRFKASCEKFLKNPSEKFFEFVDREEILNKKYTGNLVRLEFSTEKQAGDIAGTKLKKFNGYLLRELEKYFEIKDSEFSYDENRNIGRLLLAIVARKEIVFPGPPIKMEKPLKEFKKEHKNIKIIKGRAFAYEKNSLDFDKWLHNFENEKSKFISEMDVTEISKV